MSMYSGVYVGVGWIVDETDRHKMLNHIVNTERRNDVADHFHRYNMNGKWFFGDIVYEIPEGTAKTMETLITLPALTDDGSFGLKYGMLLVDCGIPVEEINTTWANAGVYIIHWVDC